MMDHSTEMLWHPAKPLLENRVDFCALHHHDRMLMSSCHIAFEHRHHLAFACIKLFLKSLVLFSKRPVFYSNAKPGSPDRFVLAAIGLQTARLKQIKY